MFLFLILILENSLGFHRWSQLFVPHPRRGVWGGMGLCELPSKEACPPCVSVSLALITGDSSVKLHQNQDRL